MTASKLNRDDAQEWMESLQQVGEGWYRQVMLAVRAGAHKALGMERKEFAQQIGQRLIDPREAILELHNEGHSRAAIADVLGVSKARTVDRVLAEEGLIEWTPDVARKALERGHAVPASALDAESAGETGALGAESDHDRLQGQINELTIALQGAESKRKREVKALKGKVDDYRHQLTELERQAREEAEKALTAKERERARKEADAWADEQAQKIKAGMSHLLVTSVVGALHEAAEAVKTFVEDGVVTKDSLNEIEAAHVGFVEELNVARMSVQTQ